jgi:hypothetical protein
MIADHITIGGGSKSFREFARPANTLFLTVGTQYVRSEPAFSASQNPHIRFGRKRGAPGWSRPREAADAHGHTRYGDNR